MGKINSTLEKLEHLKHLLAKLHGSNVSLDYIELMVSDVTSIEADVKDYRNAKMAMESEIKQLRRQVILAKNGAMVEEW
jgi:translation initiation factor 2B subunit (eIF-2B alpha/beta/delta family)